VIKVVVFDWNALTRISSGSYAPWFHDMAVRECQVMEAGYQLVMDSDQQISYVELHDETEAVEFKLRFF
jgi:hypothetical protein